MTERFGELYLITSPCGRQYVGMTSKTAAHRFRWHGYNAIYKQSKGPLADAIRMYGLEAMTLEVIAVLPLDQLANAEISEINKRGTLWPDGLNASTGGDGGGAYIPIIELGRVRKMKRTMATKAYKAKQRAIQAEVWTEDRCKERAESIRKMWADPAYREMQKAARKIAAKPIQPKLVLRPRRGEGVRRHWAKPEFRAKMSAKARERLADPAERVRLSEMQRQVMAERPEVRRQIGLTLLKYKDKRYRKLVLDVPKAKKQSVMTRTWAALPTEVAGVELWDAGWKMREILRAIARGWLEEISQIEQERPAVAA